MEIIKILEIKYKKNTRNLINNNFYFKDFIYLHYYISSIIINYIHLFYLLHFFYYSNYIHLFSSINYINNFTEPLTEKQ